jgi:putative nucleotidyltransferase with HDIG domain
MGVAASQVMTVGAAAAPAQRRAWDTPERAPTLERFYRELMTLDQLPSAPEVAQKMLVLVNRENVSGRDLATLISRDQSLTARLLRLANSAFFAIRSKVTSIPQAVTLLGFARVRDLVLGLSVWSALDGKSAAGRRHRKQMWVHTATVAAVAKMLAERNRRDGAEAFAAGLLHDVGKLVLGVRLGDSYWTMLEDATEQGESAATVEEAAFGCHHGIVGAWLMQLWQLPRSLADAVALHHDPLDHAFGLDLTTMIAVADKLVASTDPASGVAREETLAEVHGFAPDLLTPDQWHRLWADLSREQQAIAGIFEG